MKRLLFPLVAIVALAAAAFMPYAPLTPGQPMPKADVKMKDISGKEVSLNDLKGPNGLLVMFSCNTCPYVIKNQERTHEILTYARQKQVGVVVLNSNEAQRSGEDSYEAMKGYAKEQKYDWVYAVDKNHEIADAFGATRTPEVFLFDAKGMLVYTGAIDNSPSDAKSVSRKHLHEAINEMTAGNEVSVKTSKSVGCGIKRLAKP
ncbi:MAG TPA: thioredoxin family protein [Phnomibacter sp.]|nr:thioredoxin family protein [Phnomibacter sp.]